MYIDFKVMTWYRVNVPAEYTEKLTELLKAGKITCSNDVCELLDDDFEWYELIEAQEDLTPAENGGCATMEAFTEEGKLICTNEVIGE